MEVIGSFPLYSFVQIHEVHGAAIYYSPLKFPFSDDCLQLARRWTWTDVFSAVLLPVCVFGIIIPTENWRWSLSRLVLSRASAVRQMASHPLFRSALQCGSLSRGGKASPHHHPSTTMFGNVRLCRRLVFVSCQTKVTLCVWFFKGSGATFTCSEEIWSM